MDAKNASRLRGLLLLHHSARFLANRKWLRDKIEAIYPFFFDGEKEPPRVVGSPSEIISMDSGEIDDTEFPSSK